MKSAAAILAIIGSVSATHKDNQFSPAHQFNLSQTLEDVTPNVQDQEAIMANASRLSILRDDIKCFIDKLLWNDFEGMYIGIKNHMTFRSEIYLPRN